MENVRRAFSLIELLVVMAIISLLLVAAIPAFTNSTNSARQASREIIKGYLQQARAHAIASGNATAVAFPALGSDPELGAHALSLVEVENSTGQFIPVKDGNGNDKLLERWGQLSGSFHFLTSADVPALQGNVMDGAPQLTVENSVRSLPCHMIVFSSNGQIVRPPAGTPVTLAIGQGVKRNGSLTLTDRTGGAAVYDLLQINRLTGRSAYAPQ